MKSKIYIKLLLLSFLAITVGCKTIQRSDLRTSSYSLTKKLPVLTPKVDQKSLENTFTINVGGTMQGATFADKRVQDVVTLFERDVTENICEPGKVPAGTITLFITYSQIKLNNWGFLLLNCLTLCIPAILGVPITGTKEDIEIKVSISDKQNDIISEFVGNGKAKTLTGFYYGYKPGNGGGDLPSARKSNIVAYNMAMDEIKEKISKDALNLAEKLK